MVNKAQAVHCAPTDANFVHIEEDTDAYDVCVKLPEHLWHRWDCLGLVANGAELNQQLEWLVRWANGWHKPVALYSDSIARDENRGTEVVVVDRSGLVVIKETKSLKVCTALVHALEPGHVKVSWEKPATFVAELENDLRYVSTRS